MVFIKKMVANGFKSFARKTEVVFDKEVNTVIGANGSGKSNVADAICFALGRLSIKSMRAAKAKNLLFLGSKYIKPTKEASVELVFDNTDRAFAVDKDEVSLTRIVRRNGQSIYKINHETKTRAEVVELLATAGIDPHGFNIVLQGQIQYIVRMQNEERRKIIEDVAGISIYETKKEKSLHELEKTEEKLKEIGAILRERTLYLKNLDKERTQALKFKELELMQKRLKASILSKKTEEKSKELEKIVKSIEEKMNLKDKDREKVDKLQKQIEALSEQINKINKNIQQATGLEQETLHNQIANIKAELEGQKVRKENYENRKHEIERRISEIKSSIPEIEQEIRELRAESPVLAKKSQDLRKKKDELLKIEEERNKLNNLKTELFSLKEIAKDKERQISRAQNESESILRILEDLSSKLIHKNEEECAKVILSLRHSLFEREKELESLYGEELKHEKDISVSESEIAAAEKIKKEVEKIDICPLCQSKITPEHINHVFSNSDDKVVKFGSILENAKNMISNIKEKKQVFLKEIKDIKDKIANFESELLKHKSITDKKETLRKVVDSEKALKEEIIKLEERRKVLEVKIIDLPKTEEKYDSILLEIEEISSRTKEDSDTALLYKERELENVNNIVKHSTKDLESVRIEIESITKNIESKGKILAEKEEQEDELNKRFKKMFDTRDEMQRESQEKSISLSEMQNSVRQIEDQINYLKIGKAKYDAEKEAIEMELQEFPGVEIIKASFENLDERLKKTQESLMQIGSINMRALEMYDEMKKEYDIIQEKVNTLEKEKIEIMKIIEEIDKKKLRSFMKTFRAMNELFTRNFSRLYTKGVAYLEIENQEDVFSGGINIVVRLAKGKYFDVTSLSGGEQTLVALSLLFAIQEHKPYHFYIFDEIDAALDKRNSERLASLITQYMKSGQYIIITHNDAIIMQSNILYGVSMQDGVSKVLSLKLTEAKNMAHEIKKKEENNEKPREEAINKETDEVELIIDSIENEENLEDMSEKEKFKKGESELSNNNSNQDEKNNKKE